MSYEQLVKAFKNFNPVSIFIYGSRARGDDLKTSDYEVGVVYKTQSPIKRSDLHKAASQLKQVRAYPFSLEDINKSVFDVPFQNNIFYREVVERGRTIFGKQIVENLKPPAISNLDLLQEISYNLGLGVASLLSKRNNDDKTSREEFYKSCLYGLRAYIILHSENFPIGYKEISDQGLAAIDDVDYRKVIQAATSARTKNVSPSLTLIFKNLSLLGFIEDAISSSVNEVGIREVLAES